jgi:hypothetical protein
MEVLAARKPDMAAGPLQQALIEGILP